VWGVIWDRFGASGEKPRGKKKPGLSLYAVLLELVAR